MKDYYKILGLPPSATQPEIKKAYRALAFRYHPDKNPGSSLSEAQFKEVQEAYSVLSVAHKRASYDDERWLSGMGSKTRYQEAITPAWLLNICVQLNNDLTKMDTHRMSQRALQQYMLMILTDAHLGVLHNYNEAGTNASILSELIKASHKLELKYLADVEARLIVLANCNSDLLAAIDDNMEDRIRKARQEKMLPYFILLITLLLCVLMYWYGKLD